MHKHSGCCGCTLDPVGRRSFLAAMGGTALGTAALAGCATSAKDHLMEAPRVKPALAKKPLIVQPVLSYQICTPQKATSWRPWGGLKTEADVTQEIQRIEGELSTLASHAEFPVTIRPLAKVTNPAEATPLRDGDADVMLIYGAAGELEPLISPNRYNLVFVRHKSGPVYLWYEITHPRLLRKTVDEYGQPGLSPEDVVVDEYADVLWRLRSFFALKNTIGAKVVCIGGASGWGAGGQQAPQLAKDHWKMDLVNYPYEELGKRILAARSNPARVKQAEAEAEEYLKDSGVKLETDRGFLDRAFLLTQVFEEVMAEHGTHAITINNCMSTIMPMSETTACMVLSLLNDAGAMAFCESDFVVIPSGVLLQNIASTPVFLQDPTYPHHGIMTVAHCTAPRKMDGKHLEKVRIMTHFESDYGAAPKVEMTPGKVVTVIDPDFGNKRWIGFRGKTLETPYMDICRSQVDIAIEGDHNVLAQEMRGFHQMVAYGDQLKETGYALRKLGISWFNLSDNRTIEA
ncbi:MAG TPA: sugar isomerase [Candidatus Hydrogenedentes bacterium]|nr:sugar isomerase [Candidatus Hydrogenedentota bacterium]